VSFFLFFSFLFVDSGSSMNIYAGATYLDNFFTVLLLLFARSRSALNCTTICTMCVFDDEAQIYSNLPSGDGWNGNVLYIGSQTVTLATGFTGNTIVCLVPGVYSPYACGGTYSSEVRWSVGGLSGSAEFSCSSAAAAAGSFIVGTFAPTTTPAPTTSVAPTPLPIGPCIVYKVSMSDTVGTFICAYSNSPIPFSGLKFVLLLRASFR
jgi:hypothetical protein